MTHSDRALAAGALFLASALLAPSANAETEGTAPSEPQEAASEPTPVAGHDASTLAQVQDVEGLEETPEALPRGLARPRRGFEPALRASYGVPFGSSTTGTNLRALIVGVIPVQVDLGYRLNEHWLVGIFGAAGLGVKGEECREDGQPPTAPTDGSEEVPSFGVKCDAPNKFRVGAELLFHVLPTTEAVSPWLGIGLGYEWLNISETLGRRTFVQSFSGLEFVNLQGGVDFAVGSHLRLGPFVQWSLGRYSVVASDGSAGAEPVQGPGQSIHQWVNLGLKASLGPLGG